MNFFFDILYKLTHNGAYFHMEKIMSVFCQSFIMLTEENINEKCNCLVLLFWLWGMIIFVQHLLAFAQK